MAPCLILTISIDPSVQINWWSSESIFSSMKSPHELAINLLPDLELLPVLARNRHTDLLACSTTEISSAHVYTGLTNTSLLVWTGFANKIKRHHWSWKNKWKKTDIFCNILQRYFALSRYFCKHLECGVKSKPHCVITTFSGSKFFLIKIQTNKNKWCPLKTAPKLMNKLKKKLFF